MAEVPVALPIDEKNLIWSDYLPRDVGPIIPLLDTNMEKKNLYNPQYPVKLGFNYDLPS